VYVKSFKKSNQRNPSKNDVNRQQEMLSQSDGKNMKRKMEKNDEK